MLIHKELRSTLVSSGAAYGADDDRSSSITNDVSIPTQLEWSDTDPLAVKLNMHDGSKWIRWEFALDLLVVGLATVSSEWAGNGDVRVQTDSMDLCILHLSNPDTDVEALISMDWDTVQWFVGRIVSEFSAEDEARAVVLQVDTFLREINAESF